jgi:MFS family permease
MTKDAPSSADTTSVHDPHPSPVDEKKNFHKSFPKHQSALAAFRYRNYRLWFGGQLISVVGTWMQSTAQGYLIYDMTKSKAYLGHVGLATGIPTWIFMLYAGVVADRMGRRKMMIGAQLCMMFQAILMTSLHYFGFLRPWHILILAFTLGVANSFDAPARQSFLLEMVKKEDLPNAIAINSSLFNLAAVIGPALAGLSYAFLGATGCFAINSISFLAVILALMNMKLIPRAVKEVQTNHSPRKILQEFQEAFDYIKNDELMKSVLLWVSWTSLFGICYMTLLPAWAVEILQGGAKASGFLHSYRAVGAVLAAGLIAWGGPVWGMSRWLRRSLMILPSCLLLIFSTTHSAWGSYLLVACLGMSFMYVYNTANTLVQMMVPDHLRGRVMAVYAFTFFGVTPLGSYWVGEMAERTSIHFVFCLSAILTFSFYLLPFSKSLRRFFDKPETYFSFSPQGSLSRPVYSSHF